MYNIYYIILGDIISTHLTVVSVKFCKISFHIEMELTFN